MIISRTPFRVSFFGGGTDYPDWVSAHGGAVLSTAIDKYTYITGRVLPPFFDHRHRVAYSVVEHVKKAEDLRHPAIRAALAEYAGDEGLEIHCDADLPARSGLGSSSAFMVGLLNTLEALRGRRVSPTWLAREAIRYEHEVLRETVGFQDQVATAHGGLNFIRFHAGGGFQVEPVVLPPGRRRALEESLMLVFTGFSRCASEVARSQVENRTANSCLLPRLRAQVDEALDLLGSARDLRGFGELLDEGWRLKRALSDRVSTPAIDRLYGAARNAGAVGGKLLGAGGGGFLLLFVEPERRAAVRAALADLIEVPFAFENGGSQIIYHRD